jgi:hypothetical protein
METRLTTRNLVFDAADKLLKEGSRPTLELLKKMTGKSNPNQIYAALNEWYGSLGARVEQWTSRPDIPQSLFDIVENLWQTALSEANQHLLQYRQVADETVNKAKDQLESMKIDANKLAMENAELIEMVSQQNIVIEKLNSQLEEQKLQIEQEKENRVHQQKEQDQLVIRNQELSKNRDKEISHYKEQLKTEYQRSEANENRLFKRIDEWKIAHTKMQQEFTDAEKHHCQSIYKMKQMVQNNDYEKQKIIQENLLVQQEIAILREQLKTSCRPQWKRRSRIII